LPHFTLNKTQVNKTNAGNVNERQTTLKPLPQISNIPRTPPEQQQQGYPTPPSNSEPPNVPLGPPPDSIDDDDEFFEPEEPEESEETLSNTGRISA
jgi:hypothetical protein